MIHTNNFNVVLMVAVHHASLLTPIDILTNRSFIALAADYKYVLSSREYKANLVPAYILLTRVALK